MEAARRSAPECLQKEELINFAHRFQCYEALKFIGLDMKGGMEQLHEARLVWKESKLGLPTAMVMVNNADRVARYVDLGVCVGKDVSEVPGMLDQAHEAYGKIKALVGEGSGSGAVID